MFAFGSLRISSNNKMKINHHHSCHVSVGPRHIRFTLAPSILIAEEQVSTRRVTSTRLVRQRSVYSDSITQLIKTASYGPHVSWMSAWKREAKNTGGSWAAPSHGILLVTAATLSSSLRIITKKNSRTPFNSPRNHMPKIRPEPYP